MVPLFLEQEPNRFAGVGVPCGPCHVIQPVTQALLALADQALWPSALALLDGDGAGTSPVTFSAVLRACEAQGTGGRGSLKILTLKDPKTWPH